MAFVTRYPRSLFGWNDFSSLFSPEELWRNGSKGGTQASAPVEIAETDDTLTVAVDLPGINRDDIEVNLDKNVLTITGERRSEKSDDENRRYHVTERSYGQFARSFKLPSTVEAEKINAEYKDGVLQLTLPKVEAAKPREIAVS